MASHWSDSYLHCPYVRGGRGPDEYDCWGLVRELLVHLNWPELPSFGLITAHDKNRVDEAKSIVSAMVNECHPKHAALATVYRNKSLIHVGAVIEIDGRLKVLHTNRSGPHRDDLRVFRRQYLNVRFYSAKN